MDFVYWTDVADMFIGISDMEPFTQLAWGLALGAVLFAVGYVFKAVTLYTIGKREGYRNVWMAFVPVLSTYYMGVVSDKNKIGNVRARVFSAIAAVLELLLLFLYVLEYIAQGIIFAGGFYNIVADTQIIAGQTTEFYYYESYNVPDPFLWLGWLFDNGDLYIASWLSLLYALANVFVLVLFFQTYTFRHYVTFSVFAVLFPFVTSFLMFAVRNNKGKNYREYVREQQQRQYRMYQQYTRQNGGNPYNYNPYTGQPINPDNNNPYANGGSQTKTDDPFGDFAPGDGNAKGGNSSDPDDPFSDF